MADNKHFVISVPDDVIEKASQSCLRRGTTLRKTVERMIAEQALVKIKDSEAFIQETDATRETWCPSRATLFNMRTTGELVEDTHYVMNEGLIFYKLKPLRDHCRKNYPHVYEANMKRLAATE